MSSIELLDQNTIDKIAAGEVIERPASIVKELVENSIDAKSSAINIEIKNGGIDFIRITDNGSGIDASQIRKAFLRHSTSKIRQVEDLLSIRSLGFRGEALSSIAAVAQVELITKTKNALTGVRYIIEGGKEISYEEIGAPEGTTFIIRNVFFNTPARRKFLKSPGTEGGYIASLIERLSISHPDISFNFIQNGQTKLHTAGNGSLKDIAFSIYGKEIASNLVSVEAENEISNIKGYICKPIVSRGNRNFENYFINGRYVRNNIVSKAIEDAYKPFLMQHRYPFTLLIMDIPGDAVDINVYPAKQEVRFSDGDSIYKAVYEAVFNCLNKKDLIPEVKFQEEKKEFIPTESVFVNNTVKPVIERRSIRPAEPFEISRKTENLEIEKELKVESEEPQVLKESTSYNEKPLFSREKIVDVQQLSFADADSNVEIKPEIEIIGQVFDTYWIIQYTDKLFIVDQHAAHEKVLYERNIKHLKEKNHSSQLISPPVVVTLSSMEEEVLKNNMEEFTHLGYEISEFGGNEYAIFAVPMNIFGLDSKDVFVEILDSLSATNRISQDMFYEKIASMSCKAAVKGNNSLSRLEAKALLEEMFTLENPYNCPHGRPTVISMSKYELEKKFKRIL